MNEEYDGVNFKKNSYDKRLTILKDKIANYRIFKNKNSQRFSSSLFFPNTNANLASREELAGQEGREEGEEGEQPKKVPRSKKD